MQDATERRMMAAIIAGGIVAGHALDADVIAGKALAIADAIITRTQPLEPLPPPTFAPPPPPA